ncbi:MAG: hypothetical protein Q8K12_03945 [Thiobacillus sp.]|nr:hypothetical protein [Thiobacillus sp.]
MKNTGAQRYAARTDNKTQLQKSFTPEEETMSVFCLAAKPPSRAACCLLFWLCAAPLYGHAEGRVEWLFFPAVTAAHRTGLPPDDDLDSNEIIPSLDMLTTGNAGSISWLSEIFVSTDEQEWARLYAGWRLDNQNMLSAGKFHNQQGYWNTQFHHGAYLQTTIAKPGIMEDASPLPLHYVGAQFDGNISELGDGLFNYSIGIGKGAVMQGTTLESPDIVGPNELGDLSLGLRLSYTLDETSPTQFGVFFVRNDIPVLSNADWTSVTQDVAGLFANWESEPFRVIGESYFFYDKLEGNGATASGSFWYAYVQGEYRFVPRGTLYMRLEETSGTPDPYLDLFPDFALDTRLIGLRYDVIRNQAIKIEASHVQRLDDRFNQVQIQWSAVFP